MVRSLRLLLLLKWTIAKRIIRDIHPVYFVLLSVFAVSVSWGLLKADIAVT